MKEPGSGPFWMFPAVAVAYLGRDQLSPEAKAALRRAWSSTLQLRGGHREPLATMYVSLYLMAQLHPGEPGETWYTGKSSTENLAEARDYLIHWMKLATTVGQESIPAVTTSGVRDPIALSRDVGGYDPAMRLRAVMMLDWILADQFANSLDGVLHGANARSEIATVVERWNALSSYFQLAAAREHAVARGVRRLGIILFRRGGTALPSARGDLPHWSRSRRRFPAARPGADAPTLAQQRRGDGAHLQDELLAARLCGRLLSGRVNYRIQTHVWDVRLRGRCRTRGACTTRCFHSIRFRRRAI